MPTRCNKGFYCRSYCLLNMFRAPLCPSSGVQEYYTVVAACGISCCGFQIVGLVWSWGLCVRFAGCCSILQTGNITLWILNTSVWNQINLSFSVKRLQTTENKNNILVTLNNFHVIWATTRRAEREQWPGYNNNNNNNIYWLQVGRHPVAVVI